MKESYKIIERKTNNVTFSTETAEEIYKQLSYMLRAKFMYKVSWFSKVKRINLYNGYENIKFYSNGYVHDFIVSE